MHKACFKGHRAIVELLLKHNSPLEGRDKSYDSTPLGWALAVGLIALGLLGLFGALRSRHEPVGSGAEQPPLRPDEDEH